MIETNQQIKEVLRAKKIPLWRVSEVLGLYENTLLRWLQVELDGERRERVEAAVQLLLEGGQADEQ